MCPEFVAVEQARHRASTITGSASVYYASPSTQSTFLLTSSIRGGVWNQTSSGISHDATVGIGIRLPGMKQLLVAIALVLAWSRPAPAQGLDLHIDVDASGSGPAIFASRLPADQRASMTATYQQILAGYRELEVKMRLPKQDVAGVLAAFIAANVATIRHAMPSDAGFAALLEQVRSGFRKHADIARALHLDRAPVREQLEIVSMLLLGSVMGASDAAKQAALAATAKQLMTDYLQLDPAAVDLTDKGLVWTGSATGPLATLTGVEPTRAVPASPPPSPSAGADAARHILAMGTYVDGHWAGTQYTYVEHQVWVLDDGMCANTMTQAFAVGIAADRRDHPSHWAKCRRRGDDVVEWFNGKSWDKLELLMRDRLPRGFALDGSFSHETFSSTPGPYGGAYAAWNTIAFARGGQFEIGGGHGGSSGGVAVNGRAQTTRGTYAIEGYTLTLRFDDGHVETRAILADPKKLDRITLNGVVYRR